MEIKVLIVIGRYNRMWGKLIFRQQFLHCQLYEMESKLQITERGYLQYGVSSSGQNKTKMEWYVASSMILILCVFCPTVLLLLMYCVNSTLKSSTMICVLKTHPLYFKSSGWILKKSSNNNKSANYNLNANI